MTIKDIARLSGYGVSTVSRALNGHPDVSEETRRRINEVVQQYKFVPNSNARQLKQTNSKNILIVVKGSFNMFFSTIIEHMQIAIDHAGLNAVVHYIDEEDNEVVHAERLIAEQKPLGLIFLGGNSDLFRDGFRNIDLPSVICTADAEPLGFDNLGSVSVDDYDAGYRAVEYLVERGHRNIGFIGGTAVGSYAAVLRFQGAVKCLEEHGIAFEEDACVQTRFSLTCGYDAAVRLLDAKPGLTAIFAMADIMAMGAMRAIADRGLIIPDDISVIGFDGIQMALYSNPKLTTFKQPEDRLANESVGALLEMIHEGKPAPHVHLAADLVEGDSVYVIQGGTP